MQSLNALDWLIRINIPHFLKGAGLDSHAQKLSELPQIENAEQVRAILPLLHSAREAADRQRHPRSDMSGLQEAQAARDVAIEQEWLLTAEVWSTWEAAWEAAT